VLRACRAVRLDEVVLGQYTGGAGMEGYLEDKVPSPPVERVPGWSFRFSIDL
jgi:hypothetical protein